MRDLTIGRGGRPASACGVGRMDRARTAVVGRCPLWAGLVLPGLCAGALGLNEPRPLWQQAAGAGVLAAATAPPPRRPRAGRSPPSPSGPPCASPPPRPVHPLLRPRARRVRPAAPAAARPRRPHRPLLRRRRRCRDRLTALPPGGARPFRTAPGHGGRPARGGRGDRPHCARHGRRRPEEAPRTGGHATRVGRAAPPAFPAEVRRALRTTPRGKGGGGRLAREDGARARAAPLVPRERAVLSLVGVGLSMVKAYVSAELDRLGVRDRVRGANNEELSPSAGALASFSRGGGWRTAWGRSHRSAGPVR